MSRRAQLKRGMDFDIICEDTRWEALDLPDLAGRAVTGVCARLGIVADALELSVLGCDDAHILTLNAEFRDKSAPTNVLSWPAQDVTPPDLPRPDPDGTLPLGDIALAYETCIREAQDQGKETSDHVTHLLVHGMLHLLGYDHICDDDAAIMETIEVEILGNLGISDPYLLNPLA